MRAMTKTSPLPRAPVPDSTDDRPTTPSVSAARLAALFASSGNDNLKHVDVESVLRTGSTNTHLMQQLPRLKRPLLYTADIQTAGRGRAGRSWRTNGVSTLTFSLAWRFARPQHALMGLPLAVGVAVAEALKVFGVPVQLKWPNDVLRDGAKLAGILIETAADSGAGDATWAVIGVGLNLDIPPEMEAELGRAIGTAPELRKPARETVLAVIVSSLADVLVEFGERGFGAFSDRWEAVHAYTGQAVKVLDNGRIVHTGQAAGVDVMGRFLIETDTGLVPVLAGDLSLRLQE